MQIRVERDGRVEERELLLISHRGGNGFGPENTLQSLRAALEFGVEMIETDVRMSADGVPVIHHGPFLGYRLLGRMSLEEIRERAPEVPTLEEYLQVAGGRCALNLEIKSCHPRVLVSLLDGGGHRGYPLLISSFDAGFLSAFAATGHRAETGLLVQYERDPERMVREARACGAGVLLPVVFAVDRELVSKAHDEGLRVIAWTVNSRHQLKELLEAGVDGVITDEYPKLYAFLRERYS